MKHLGSAAGQAEIRRRLMALTAEDHALWGRMNAGQMVCHLREAFHLALGERRAAAVVPRMRPGVLKFLALRMPVRWPQNVPTVQELKSGPGSEPGEFARDHAELVGSFERFCEMKSNRTMHPIFGAMTPGDWMRWGYLHTDHHLRQFGR